MRLWVAGKDAKKEKLKQLPTRVPAGWMEVLQTAQYLNGYDSMQALVRAIIEDFVRNAEAQPATKKALEARHEHQGQLQRRHIKVAEDSRE